MENYNPQKIEKKWQKRWEEDNTFKADDFSKKEKFYVLVEFPYPSGAGLHTGHCRGYFGLDILARKKRMQGFNVLFPMGWDSFGLPTENYAIKTGIHPEKVTKENTENFKKQEKMLGLSFDWTREVNTSAPSYYKWTQWIFIQLFKKGLAYKQKTLISWCVSCKIGLANEEVVGGKCERCGGDVVKKEKEQWILAITKYADRLIKDLALVDYPEKVKISQKEWIGKSRGLEIRFQIVNSDIFINAFTTRQDTIFGATYLVLSPESPVLQEIEEKIGQDIENLEQIKQYIKKAKETTDRKRVSEVKEKQGIEIHGIKAINPANNRELPIFVADYVLMSYGTGAIMAVPAHDTRDFEFAKKHNLAIKEVIQGPQKEDGIVFVGNDFKVYEGEGVLVNSARFDGMDSAAARQRISKWLISQEKAEEKTYYKLRDWIFSRQRYWGEPIPMINCPSCGWVSAPEKDLPVALPKIKDFKPTEQGDSPLKKAKEWISVSCPSCGALSQRETDVMPNWAGSNWYFLRYCDPQNNNALADKGLLKKWMPVDWYNGGMEHTTLHLLYSRFIYKFLWDIGAVPKEIGPEPYKKRTSHGTVLGEGGIKMSKSKGNTINPEDIVKKYGADVLRVYEMFMGPFQQAIPWDSKGLVGAKRFLKKVWELACENSKLSKKDLIKELNKTIKKVSEDIDSLKFNTAISALMKFCNTCQGFSLNRQGLKDFIKILSPFAPHIAEELWQINKFEGLCCSAEWPEADKKALKSEKTAIIIQINGKVRDVMEAGIGLKEEEIKKTALSREKVKKWIQGKQIKKTVFVPEKLINFIV